MKVKAITAATEKLKVGNNAFAFRKFGPEGTRPIIFLNHLAANLDNWDPKLIDLIAEKRQVILFDNLGIGASSGRVAKTIEDMAAVASTFISRVSKEPVDVIALSMGGMVGQEILLQQPKLINKMVLVGTGPRGGTGIERVTATTIASILKATFTGLDPKQFIFFKRNETGRAASKEFIARLSERNAGNDLPVSVRAFRTQLTAIKKFAKTPKSRLQEITTPCLVINGDQDIMVPTPLSYELANSIPRAELEIFEDSGHGSLFQFPEKFTARVLEFLESVDEPKRA